MSVEIEEKLKKIPIINAAVFILKKFKLRSLEGLSLYDLLEMYIIGIIRGALTYRASAISFSFFMALFPFLLFLLNMIPYVPIKNFSSEFQLFIQGLLPPKSLDFFWPVVQDIVNKKRSGLLSTGFLLSIFLMANGVNAIFGGFENSYHENKARNVFRQYIVAVGTVLILAFLVIAIVVAYIFVQSAINSDWLGYYSDFTSAISSFVFFGTTIYFITAILYYFGTKQGKEFRFFSPGALLSTILIVLTTYFFGIYINNFSQYNELYGTIGGLLILMAYIWLNSNIILLGFELNASLYSLKHKF
ncbi:YihY/virulence factor BrkB family protein [Zhouia sp. PK063]|uniref:YihY/virulence factor BrkB family protein n=1 Tax=Zhouia sp. PK063 TaxID=3373602 RepID=UPI0037B81350